MANEPYQIICPLCGATQFVTINCTNGLITKRTKRCKCGWEDVKTTEHTVKPDIHIPHI
jgi:hypothetical protein